MRVSKTTETVQVPMKSTRIWITLEPEDRQSASRFNVNGLGLISDSHEFSFTLKQARELSNQLLQAIPTYTEENE